MSPDGGEQAGAISPLTRSTAVAVYGAAAPAGDAASATTSLTKSVGGVVSTTVTLKLLLLERPELVAVQVTFVAPSGNTEPEAGLQVTAAGFPVASAAVATNFTLAPFALVASATMLFGTVSVGGALFWMVIAKPCEALFPDASTAVAQTE
jgi:hypothetical protein